MKVHPHFDYRSLLLAVLALSALLGARGASDRSKAVEQAKQTQAALAALTPGTFATSASGYSMKAKLNGKDWVSTSMMPPDAAGRIIGYKNGESISFPYDRRYQVAGKTIKVGENRAVDLVTNDDIAFWGGRTGEMHLTKVDQTSAEGTFFFTATSRETTKKIEVTEGSFRILFGKK